MQASTENRSGGIALVVVLVLDVAFIFEDEEDDENEDDQTVRNFRTRSYAAFLFLAWKQRVNRESGTRPASLPLTALRVVVEMEGMNRRLLSFLSLWLGLHITALAQSPPASPVKQTVHITMRDGVKLAADVFLPTNPPPFPVVLLRSPYNKDLGAGIGADGVKRGYAVVIQDTRGRFVGPRAKTFPFTLIAGAGITTASTHWNGSPANLVQRQTGHLRRLGPGHYATIVGGQWHRAAYLSAHITVGALTFTTIASIPAASSKRR